MKRLTDKNIGHIQTWINALRNGEYTTVHNQWIVDDKCGCAVGIGGLATGCNYLYNRTKVDSIMLQDELSQKTGLSASHLWVISNMFEGMQTVTDPLNYYLTKRWHFKQKSVLEIVDYLQALIAKEYRLRKKENEVVSNKQSERSLPFSMELVRA